MQALRVQPCPGVAPELAWKYAGPFEKVGVPATLLACRHQQEEIRVCTGLFRMTSLLALSRDNSQCKIAGLDPYHKCFYVLRREVVKTSHAYADDHSHRSR